MPYALVNNENLTVPIVCTTAAAADAWSHLMCGMDDNIILSLNERKGFATFTDLELQILYYNLTRTELTVKEYADKLKSVYEQIKTLPVVDLPASEVEKRFLGPGHDFSTEPVVDKPRRWAGKSHGFESAPVKGKTPSPRAKSSTGGGDAPVKPRGGTTARVWEIATKIKEEQFTDGNILDPQDMKALRSAIIAACEAEGINSSTAGTQYSKWKRDQGFHN